MFPKCGILSCSLVKKVCLKLSILWNVLFIAYSALQGFSFSAFTDMQKVLDTVCCLSWTWICVPDTWAVFGRSELWPFLDCQGQDWQYCSSWSKSCCSPCFEGNISTRSSAKSRNLTSVSWSHAIYQPRCFLSVPPNTTVLPENSPVVSFTGSTSLSCLTDPLLLPNWIWITNQVSVHQFDPHRERG